MSRKNKFFQDLFFILLVATAFFVGNYSHEESHAKTFESIGCDHQQKMLSVNYNCTNLDKESMLMVHQSNNNIDAIGYNLKTIELLLTIIIVFLMIYMPRK